MNAAFLAERDAHHALKRQFAAEPPSPTAFSALDESDGDVFTVEIEGVEFVVRAEFDAGERGTQTCPADEPSVLITQVKLNDAWLDAAYLDSRLVRVWEAELLAKQLEAA